MKKASLFLILVIAAVLISGCGSSAPEPVSEISEIVGTWKSDPPALAIRILPDGTVPADVTVNKINEGARWEYSFSFEGGQLIMGGNYIGCLGKSGLYDVQILSNGNLFFTVVEDDCLIRVNAFMGRRAGPMIDAEWINVE